MPESITRVLAVAWRDFKHTVLTKAFLFGAIGVPVLMVGLVAILIPLMQPKPRPLTGSVAIVDAAGLFAAAVGVELDPDRIAREQVRELADAAESGLGGAVPDAAADDLDSALEQAARQMSGRIEVTVETHADAAALESLKKRVRDGELLAVAVLDARLAEPAADDAGADAGPAGFPFFVDHDLEPRHARLLERRLAQAVVRVRIERAGLDVDEALSMVEPPRADTTRLLAGGDEAAEGEAARVAQEMIPVVFMMLLWGATFASAQHLLMSTIEEKSNKVVEVLLSAVSPLQLMAGKILGQGLVGLIILGMYSALGIVTVVALALMHLVPVLHLVYLAVYFFMGYFMIASIMAGVGSAVSEIREANSLITPAMILLFIPLMLWPAIREDPNGLVGTAFSFIPPAIPFVMILRVTASEPVPVWQVVASIVWGYLAVAGMVWMAARIFRVGVLMYGKPPTPLELIKWIRYS